MNTLRRIGAIGRVAVKRILSQPGLALATTVGLVVAVALTISIPAYADAVYYRTFVRSLSAPGESPTPRPPFAFMFLYGGGLQAQVEWEDVQPVDAYLTSGAGADLGLPQTLLVRHFRTQYYPLYPADATTFTDASASLVSVRFSFISDLEQHVTLVEGSFPAAADPAPESVADVLVSDALALELGMQVGETYIVFAQDKTPDGVLVAQEFPVRIAGVWRAADPAEAFWFNKPELLDNHLFVPEATFAARISPYLPDEIYSALWYLIMDGSRVDYLAAGALVERVNVVEQRVNNLLPNTRLEMSPRAELNEYRRAAEVMTLLLYAFAVPIVGLLLAFVGMAASLAVEQRRNEIAVLRSRGAMALQMVGVALLEGLLLGATALAVGSPAGAGVAGLIGQTRGFLDFSARPTDLRIGLSVITLAVGASVIALSLAAQVFPTLDAARHTVITYKQERARLLRRPWWQRAWLDVLLLIPAAYGTHLLRQQGGIAGASLDPLQNPLLLLVPALSTLALTLFFLRLVPLLMRVIAWVAARARGVALLMAARHLSRSPGFYNTPLALLALTLSLSTFTASLAQTLDRHLRDRAYYQVGADVEFYDFGEDASLADENVRRWRFLPISDYVNVPGVHAAARVGRFEATTTLSGGRQEGTFLGIDRLDFPQVAFWRRDFAPDTLGALMNALALNVDGVLVPRRFMQEHALQVNDTIRIVVRANEQHTDLDLRILAAFDLFPTWYPQDGPLFVGNLEYYFQQLGTLIPYNVWLRADPGVGEAQLNLRYSRWKAAVPQILREQERPERQGLFGLLSVGFTASAVLTVLGFLLYALFSFRRRAIEMGVLRAIGLSSRQMVAFLAWELAFLIGMGGLIGTILGASVSAYYIPFLQVGADPAATIPPFVVEIAWPAIFRIYALFALLFVLTLVGLAALLRRMQIFQAIKLGETV